MDGTPETSPPRSALAWKAAGWLCVGIAAVGAVVPLLPTTLFLIVALACFTRGSPRLARRLLAHPRFGPPLAAWQEHRIVSRRGKTLAVVGMSLAVVLVALTTDGWLATALVGATLLGVAGYVVTRPSVVPAPAAEDTPAVTPAR